MTELGLNRRMVRAVYPKVDWDEYDREVIAESLPAYEAARSALEGCVGALAITVTNAQGSELHWCNRQSGHDATCSGMLATIANGRAALAAA